MRNAMKMMMLVALILVVSGGILEANIYWASPDGTTNSWFTTSYWNTDPNGTGTSRLPLSSDNATLRGGLCYIDGGSNVVVDTLRTTLLGDMYLDINAGASLTVNHSFYLGAANASAEVTVRGDLELGSLNKYTIGDGSGASTSILKIDGGNFKSTSSSQYMRIGDSSTGIVEVVNGGVLYNSSVCAIGSGSSSESNGKLIIQDGAVTNMSVFFLGWNGGYGSLIVNGGELYSGYTGNGGVVRTGISSGSTGLFEVNGGNVTFPNAYNSGSGSALIYVGYQGGTGTFIQNGGNIETVGISVSDSSGGSGTAVISNGLFKAMSNNGNAPCYSIYDGSKLTIAGGEFQIYTNTGSAHIYGGGTLEISGGKLSVRGDNYPPLYTSSNSTIRIIGSKAEINVGWWKYDTDGETGPANTTMELILTQDEGHISTFNSPKPDNYTALSGTLDVGFAGGACMLSTNDFTYMHAGSSFYSSIVDPHAYGLDLWDVAANVVATGGGKNMDIYLKASESKGTLSLPNATSADFTSTAYGYVKIDNLSLGTLPELRVRMKMTAGAKSLSEIVQELKSAGYTNSAVISSDTIEMQISAADITTDDGYFAWDFREFDGTVNATVSEVNFSFNPKGTVCVIE